MSFSKFFPALIILIGGIAIGYFIGINSQKSNPVTTLKQEKTDLDGALLVKNVTDTRTEKTTETSEPPKEQPKENTGANQSTSALLTSGNACFSDDEALSLKLSLFAERLEKDSIWYNNREPEKLADCSGIFHRVVQHVKSGCDAYEYPNPAVARDSRSVARWYNSKNNLVVIDDASKHAKLIRPGSVLFFGGSGKSYVNPSVEQVTAPLPAGIVEHIGVVTEVETDSEGKVVGYVMFHGRRPGVTAKRSHYHNIKPPRLGFPPLGNWNQQLVGIAYIMTPKEG